MKNYITHLILMFLGFNAIANEVNSISPWLSISSIWGDGNVGLAHKSTSNVTSIAAYNFVFDWSDKDFNYHEGETSLNTRNVSLGLRYRWQSSNDEWSPFAGYYTEYRFKYPITLYNELEYRFSPAIYASDYWRSRSLITLYSSKSFEEKYGLRPYCATELFANWDSEEVEKTRALIGYMMQFEKVKGTVYYIPWIDGTKEETWKDKHQFGAGVILGF